MINEIKQLIADGKMTAESVLNMSRDELAKLTGTEEGELSESKYKAVMAFMVRQIDISKKVKPARELYDYLTVGKRQWFKNRFPYAVIHMPRAGVIEIVLDGFEEDE